MDRNDILNILDSLWGWFSFAVAMIAGVLIVLIFAEAMKDYDRREQCTANGGKVITGVGYMGRGWECKITAPPSPESSYSLPASTSTGPRQFSVYSRNR